MASTTPPVLFGFCLCVVVCCNSGLVAAEEKVVSRMKPTKLSKLFASGFSSRITDDSAALKAESHEGLDSAGFWKDCSAVEGTREDNIGWVEVDLLAEYSITKVAFIFHEGSTRGPAYDWDLWVLDEDESIVKECPVKEITTWYPHFLKLEAACNVPGRSVRVGSQLRIANIFFVCDVEVWAEVEPGKLYPENVAVGKTASQSSTVGAYSASLAVDNEIWQIIDDGPGCAVAEGTSPWWEVDLGGLFDITHVVFTNRYKEFEKLHDVYVGVREKEDPHGEHICGPPVKRVGSGETVVVACARGWVRYVQLWISDDDPLKEQTLTLCEVQVYGTPSPPRPVVTEQVVSYNKPTIQSSVEGLGFATRAVDGNKDTNPKTGQSCIQTKREGNPLWQVDLIDSFNITKLRITTPAGEDERDRVKQVFAVVYDGIWWKGQICVNEPRGLPSGKTMEFECRAVGRYVLIMVTHNISVVGGNSLREVSNNSNPANPFWAATSKVLESIGAATSDVLRSLGLEKEVNSGALKGSGMDSSKVERSVGASNLQDESKTFHYLSLCEVEVLAEVQKGELIPKNVALVTQLGQAGQSTTSEFHAVNAIDDNLDPANNNTASLTQPQYRPKWHVKLNGVFDVSHVAFTLPYCEQCQPPRNIWLMVKGKEVKDTKHVEGDARGAGHHRCGPFESLVLGETTLAHCPLQSAGFVEVWIASESVSDRDQLHLSEVQVYSKQPASLQPMTVPSLVLCAMLTSGVMLLTLSLA